MCSEEKIYIRNDKSKLTVHQKWVKQETKRLHDRIEKNSDIESSSYKSLYSKILEKLNSNRKAIKNQFSGVCKRIEKIGISFQKLEIRRKLKPTQKH